ncbi:RND family efflux transporter, MFP subunit [Hoeflea phototrophica DFL-43]|jgi:RND family efflux transporter MFP subunit|uniref:RND family efflux transporter, MFP subunit n=1 Tax=Hoeflea phototrophica (strain DSM 17068 / NCIMB 14078 / DFL-43) TaxID=411684 RepID=A9D793_HOEPD|nr:efflux RND transporter periplasmic adaptor subunit [Hoeflea phototrophica]EDQ33030.1 RND family efflux transporter, MFP subunit [Hoeflea phototrophica DFL-43]
MVTKTASSLACLVVFLFTVPVPAIAQQPLAVEIVEAVRAPEHRSYSLTGEIRADQSVMSAFPVGGRVIEVLADVGDMVEKDMILARLDPIQSELAVRAAEAGLVTAQADHRQAIEDYERAKSLLVSGAGTLATRDSAEDALGVARGALQRARAELQSARKTLSDTVLRAPSASTVLDRMVEPGQIVGAAQAAMELALDKGYEAVFEVSEAMVLQGAPTSDIQLSRLSSPQRTFLGRIKEISPLVDVSTGTVEAKVEVIDPPTGLDYGEPVRGTATRYEGDLIRLPFEAISASREGPAVWKVDRESMQVSLQQIEIDRHETGLVLVSNGIEDGDWIVTKGSQLLYPGRKVRRVEVSQ